MPFFPVDLSIPPLPPVELPPTPEVIDVPADLPTLEPDIVISFPLNEQVMDMVVVPKEHAGQDVIYVAVSQERVNVWAALVYFNPEIALGLTVLVVLVAVRKFWVSRRFTHRKGEHYCKKCWAGLTGVQSETCPECGRAVKKTRRTARRSKRSLAHPRWCWITAAVAAVLCTTTLWFSESWRDLYKNGFDWQQPDDWWALVGPVDAKSPIRLNDATVWMRWYSAPLAEFARERDREWIKLVAREIPSGEGTQHRWLLRRYSTVSGQLLSQTLFPESVRVQEKVYLASSDPRLAHLSGIVFIYDDMQAFRYRHDFDEPWVSIGARDEKVIHTDMAVTSDAGHIVLIQRMDRSGSYRDLRVSVWDAESGAFVSQLYAIFATRRVAALWPEMRQTPGIGPSYYEVEYPAESVVPMEDGGLLMGSFDAQAVWRFEEGTFTRVELRDQDPGALRDDLCTRWRDPLAPIPLGRGRRMTPVQLERYWAAAQRTGQQWTVHPRLDERLGRPRGLSERNVFWERYDESMDVPLYAIEQVQGLSIPTKVMRIAHPHGNERAWISPAGRWLCIADSRWRQQYSPLLVDVEGGVFVGSLDGGPDFSADLLSFMNGGEQIVVVGGESPPQNRVQSRYPRDELHLYNMPATDENSTP